MTASSYKNSHYHPNRARVNRFIYDGWCTKTPSRSDQWLQVDLGKLYQVCGVATQGGEMNDKGAWVTAFKLLYSQDGKHFVTYKDGNGKEMVRFNIIWTKRKTTMTILRCLRCC